MDNELLQEQEQPIAPQPQVDIEKIIADLKEQGLEGDAILEALVKMVEEGKIAEEDLEKAKEILLGEEKEEASKLFGVDLM